MKYKICRLIITRRVYDWVCFNLDVGQYQEDANIPLDARARFARWFVRATVVA